ncbi:transmembrane emp24 domain-containing protein bai-like [Penaeus chinensis]|uniref:transmembrane emp24 domain-containing protein bai-like n=1 Tax=Penaeus chinensis TaxID=139456 RepID=UPI001FB6770E|nr:transmembrane emp24 domain-containing protein bai-like [Penaeus chinensis]
MGRLTWVMAIVGLLAAAADGIMFHLQPNTQKCLREEIHKDVLVSGEYEIQETPGQKVDIQVTDSKGHHLYIKEEADSGKFIFNTEDYDVYDVCFISRVPATQRGIQQEVTLNTKHGVEAKTYEAVSFAFSLCKILHDIQMGLVSGY